MVVIVEACYITPTTIQYYCPCCWTNSQGKKFKSNKMKNGKVAKYRVPTTHKHGNETESIEGNWVSHRASHCRFNDEPVEIHITDQTERRE
jgi:hypothetical protein